MTNSMILDIVEIIQSELEEIDVQIFSADPFVYDDRDRKYENAEDLRKDIAGGMISAFINCSGILGESVWAFLEVEE